MIVALLFIFVIVTGLFIFARGITTPKEDTLSQALQLTVVSTNSSYRPQSSGSETVIYRRCYDYLACEYSSPVVELKDFMFVDGQVRIQPKMTGETKETINEMINIYASKAHHLPSSLAQLNFNDYDFVAGPKINTQEALSGRECDGKWRNESATFLFHWEDFNGYHSMNDNVFSVLASVYLETALSTDLIAVPKSLYLFKRPAGQSSPTSMFKLLHSLFHGRVHSAGQLLRGGPHCLRHASWGTAFKPFYRDSLFHLRTKLYELFKYTLALQFQFPLALHGVHGDNPLMVQDEAAVRMFTKKGLQKKKSVHPKVIIMTRSSTKPSNSAQRKLAKQSEEKMIELFRLHNAEASICCSFGSKSNPEEAAKEIAQALWDVDICIGIHGAGLANCVLGAEGMIVVELQTHHNYGFDSFMKIAHNALGHYLFYDIRKAKVYHGQDGAGTLLTDQNIQDIVYLALGLWKYSMDVTLPQIKARKAVYDQRPIPMNAFTKSNNKSFEYSYHDPKLRKDWHLKRYNEHPRLVHNLFYSQEFIVNREDQIVYLNQATMTNELTHLFAGYLYFPVSDTSVTATTTKAPQLKSRSFKFQSHENHAGYQSIELLLTKITGDPSILKLNEKNQINIRRVRSEVSNQITPYHHESENKREYIIFLNPYLHVHTQETVLGPLLEENYMHCIRLPYFKFRMLLMPFHEHKAECDRNWIFKSRSGRNDNLNALLG